MNEPKHLIFREIPKDITKDEKAYAVVNKYSGLSLGTIEWTSEPHWNRYAFFPLKDTMYEEDCLRDIADFCEKLTNEENTK